LAEPEGRVSHYDLVNKLIKSRISGRGGSLAMIERMLKTGWIERLPGEGCYRQLQKCDDDKK
jgi:hypothetical protein